MANNFVSKLAVVAAGAVLVLSSLEASAQAASITYNLSFTNPSNFPAGGITGATGAGSFTFDNASVSSSIAFQSIPVSALGISLSSGESYQLANSVGAATADFFAGVFSGLNYAAADATGGFAGSQILSFTVSRGTTSLLDTSFNPAETPVTYTVVPPTNVIPTPALLPGLVGLGAAALRNRKQQAA
jgi:hypothetical protein